MQSQQRNIVKTVVIIVAVMVIILALFINKITTPRYLSDIELKINGLVLLKNQVQGSSKTGSWQLLASTPEQLQFLEKVIPQLNQSIRHQTEWRLVEDNAEFFAVLLKNHLPNEQAIVLMSGEQLRGYFKPPFDEHKFLLTYSSVVTHR